MKTILLTLIMAATFSSCSHWRHHCGCGDKAKCAEHSTDSSGKDAECANCKKAKEEAAKEDPAKK